MKKQPATKPKREPKGVWLIVDPVFGPQSVHGLMGSNHDFFLNRDDALALVKSLHRSDSIPVRYIPVRYIPAPRKERKSK